MNTRDQLLKICDRLEAQGAWQVQSAPAPLVNEKKRVKDVKKK